MVKLKKFKELKKEHDEFFAKFNEKIANKKKPKVLVLMGLPGSYMAATEKSYVGNLVKLAGGENIIKGTEEFKNLNLETALMITRLYFTNCSCYAWDSNWNV